MAKSNIQVLSASQLRNIQKKVVEVFAEDLDGQLTFDVKKFEKQITQILKSMELEETFHSKNGKHKGWKIASLTPRRQSLAMRGYILIFKFREFLLNETINYRYYYEDDQGQSHVTEFTEKDIAKYVKFTEAGIQINASALKLRKVKEEWDSIINEYFQKYTSLNYMQKAKGGYGYVVRSSIMERYFDENAGLRTKAGQYQMFNKGHIYEAIDSSLSHVLFKDNATSIEAEALQNYVFGKYLMLDSIRGSKGGDNAVTNTSIKSGDADLYDFYTIKIQLEAILSLLRTSPVDKEEMALTISNLFLHQSKFDSEDAMQTAANSALDKLLDIIQNSNE